MGNSWKQGKRCAAALVEGSDLRHSNRIYSAFVFLLFAGIVLVGITGCVADPRYKGIAAGNSSEYSLGVAVDAELRVVEVGPQSPAERAGVQVGDLLVSLTWILSERPEELGGSQGIVAIDDGTIVEGEVISDTESVASLAEQAQTNSGTVLFTDTDEIRTLISYGVPLRLRVLREGQMLRLTIIPMQDIPTVGTEVTSDAALLPQRPVPTIFDYILHRKREPTEPHPRPKQGGRRIAAAKC